MAASLAKVLVKADPARAHILAPSDGVIAGAYADRLLSLDLQAAANSRSSILATTALRRDPTVVKAVSVLGMQQELRSETERSNRTFAYATQLSRRELRPQIWAIEKAVLNGDISNAIAHYDIALKTSFAAQDLLYPVLASALKEPRIRAALLQTLSSRPPWAPTFATFITMSGTDPVSAAALLNGGGAAFLPVTPQQSAVLQETLIELGRADEAWRYYRSVNPQARSDRSRDPGFAKHGEDAGPFDWRTGAADGVSAVILGSSSGGAVEFSAAPARSGDIVFQSQLLKAGAYRLRSRAENVEGVGAGELRWELRCQSGRILGSVTMAPSGRRNAMGDGQFFVPGAGCPIQTLALALSSRSTATEATGQITAVQLVPAPR